MITQGDVIVGGVDGFVGRLPIGASGKVLGVVGTNVEWVVPTGGSGGGGAVSSVNGQVGAVILTKSDLNLGSVDNTSDLLKPVSNATALSITNTTAPIAHVGSGATAHALASTTVAGFLSASDKIKIDGIITSTTLAGYGITNSYTKTETETLIGNVVGAAPAALDTLVEIGVRLQTEEGTLGALITTVSQKAPIASPTFTGTVGGIDKTMVGLPYVDNTSDVTKVAIGPIFDALSLKAPTTHIGSGGGAHSNATVSVAGFMSATDKFKLDALESSTFINPMAATGDMIIGGTSGDLTRLAKGVNAQILTLVSGYPSWQNPTEAPVTKLEASTELQSLRLLASPIASDLEGSSFIATKSGEYRVTFNGQFLTLPGVVATQAAIDLTYLIAQINALTFVSHLNIIGAGETITPGFYNIAGAGNFSGNLIFDADNFPNAMWVIRCDAALAIATSSICTLANGAKASNIFWLVDGSLTMGATCYMKGTYISQVGQSPGTALNLEGRILCVAGGISLATATYAAPLGEPIGLNLGVLKSMALFSSSGPIGNTTVLGNIGDLCSGAGSITGTAMFINGSIYNPTDTNSRLEVGIYANDVLVPYSKISVESKLYNANQIIVATGTVNVTAGQKISAKVHNVVGTCIAVNRSLYAQKVS
jgi:hypothetical protein